MATTADVQVKGLKQFHDFMQTLPVKMEQSVLRGALREAAKPVHEQVVANLEAAGSVETGKLKAAVRIRTSAKKGRITAAVRIAGKRGKVSGRNLPNSLIAYWLEFTGAAAHKIKPKPGGRLFFGGVFVRGIDHPGFKAKPFMGPALAARANDATAAAAAYMRRTLARKHGFVPDAGDTEP